MTTHHERLHPGRFRSWDEPAPGSALGMHTHARVRAGRDLLVIVNLGDDQRSR